MSSLLAASDVFALATTFEGFLLSILEAMRAGLPVVASNVGGVFEAVEDGVTGFLVRPSSPGALSEALRPLLMDRELRRHMGRAGRSRYEAQFALQTMYQKTLAVYQSILE